MRAAKHFFLRSLIFCELCALGYYAGDAICLPVEVANCDTYIRNTTTCTACKSNFYLDAINNKCNFNEISFCDKYLTNGTGCQTCQAGYYLDNNACLLQSKANCAKYVDNVNECSLCLAGYYLDANNCFQQNITNCSKYTAGANLCEECNAGFYLANNSCLPQSIAQCQTYNLGVNECTLCNIGYYLSDNTCKDQNVVGCKTYAINTNACQVCDNSCEAQNIVGCATYVVNANACSACSNNYSLTGTTCTAVISVTNCQTLSASSVAECVVCDPKYYLTVDKKCQTQSVENCATFVSNENACQICDSGYYVDAAKTCTAQSVANCMTYVDNKNACSFCKTGFYVTETGICATQSVDNCVTYVPNKNLCGTCKTGYDLVDGRCTLSTTGIANCATVKDFVCLLCNETYYLKANQCFKQNIPNCQVYIQNENKCQTCLPGYSLSIGNCVQQTTSTIKNCLVEEAGKCTACKMPYTPSSDKTICEERTDFTLKYLGTNQIFSYLTIKYSITIEAEITADATPKGYQSAWYMQLNDDLVSFVIYTTDMNYLVAINGSSVYPKLADFSVAQDSESWIFEFSRPGFFFIKNKANNLYLQNNTSIGPTMVEFGLDAFTF